MWKVYIGEKKKERRRLPHVNSYFCKKKVTVFNRARKFFIKDKINIDTYQILLIMNLQAIIPVKN